MRPRLESPRVPWKAHIDHAHHIAPLLLAGLGALAGGLFSGAGAASAQDRARGASEALRRRLEAIQIPEETLPDIPAELGDVPEIEALKQTQLAEVARQGGLQREEIGRQLARRGVTTSSIFGEALSKQAEAEGRTAAHISTKLGLQRAMLKRQPALLRFQAQIQARQRRQAQLAQLEMMRAQLEGGAEAQAAGMPGFLEAAAGGALSGAAPFLQIEAMRGLMPTTGAGGTDPLTTALLHRLTGGTGGAPVRIGGQTFSFSSPEQGEAFFTGQQTGVFP